MNVHGDIEPLDRLAIAAAIIRQVVALGILRKFVLNPPNRAVTCPLASPFCRTNYKWIRRIQCLFLFGCGPEDSSRALPDVPATAKSNPRSRSDLSRVLARLLAGGVSAGLGLVLDKVSQAFTCPAFHYRGKARESRCIYEMLHIAYWAG